MLSSKLIFTNFFAEIQLPCYGIQLLSLTQSFGQSYAMAGYWLISITSCNVHLLMPAACVDSSLQLRISAKTV
jgi:hypothetical protein